MFSLEQWGQSSWAFLLQHSTFTNIAVGIIVGIGLVRWILSRQRVFIAIPKVTWLVLALFLFAYLSTLWGLSDKAPGLWKHQIPYIAVIIVFAPLLVTQVKDYEVIFNALLVFALPLVIFLLFFVTWDNRRIVIQSGTQEFFGNPLEIGTLGAVVLLIAMFHNPPILKFAWSAARWFVTALCLGLIVASGSRGQLLGGMAAVILVWPLVHRIKSVGRFISLAISLLLFILLVGWGIEEFSQKNIRWSEDRISQDISGRFDSSVIMLERWAETPWSMLFGLGNSSSFAIIGIYPHNVPAEVLSEEGIIGFLLYASVIALTIRSAVRILRLTTENLVGRRTFAILLGYCFFTLVVSLKQGSLISNLNFFMTTILLGQYEIFVRKSDLLLSRKKI
ncbi:O-antigen ligase family protein [Allochromatium humboldtianum]|uniref:O-antigen ligase family protein n=1 Tax=Allochromatium humboldtianum TaxID=504901 RepID=A0A850R403_9GAMM|nr:O-antigen ligase family protein [Allochromatium humboldtianum]NVZ08088.1 O-antigen ligase family protein [Allochromatium humboldtianum]